jgi:hypothetical protein
MSIHGPYLRAVTNHTAEYIRTWCGCEFVSFIAQVLLAAGCGPARITTCQHTLERVRGWPRVNRQLLARAASLLRPSDPPALRVSDAVVFDVILSALRGDDRAAGARAAGALSSHPEDDEEGAATPVVPSRILDSLQAVGWTAWSQSTDGALTIVRHCAGTLKELDCRLTVINDEWNDALARCTQLELLGSAVPFEPAAWLGLSHLHTLLGVDLTAVSVAAIAAALPQLHTFGITSDFRSRVTAASVAGFFETLLPRLRVFRVCGKWPVDDATPTAAASAPLPLLQELVWNSIRVSVVDGFEGAQPVVLWAPNRSIVKFLAASQGACCGLLSRVCDLQLYGDALQPSVVAEVLRAAPELRGDFMPGACIENWSGEVTRHLRHSPIGSCAFFTSSLILSTSPRKNFSFRPSATRCGSTIFHDSEHSSSYAHRRNSFATDFYSSDSPCERLTTGGTKPFAVARASSPCRALLHSRPRFE